MIAMRALALSSAYAAALLAAPVQATAPVQVLTSPGGVGYWLVEEHAIPMVALEISFEGGAATDPEAQTGAARFLSAMLDEGAGDLDSVAFST